MNQEVKDILKEIYAEHKLNEKDLDYSIAEQHKADLNRLSLLNNCCFFIVDLHKFEYLFTSDNFKSFFGYTPTKEDSKNLLNDNLLDSKIHPDDFIQYKKIQLKVGKFILTQPKEEQINYKHILELRVQNIQGQYIRVLWERQALETDKAGNLWLMLGSITILPDQSNRSDLKNFFINLKNGERIDLSSSDEIHFKLSPREKEILQLIHQGLLSKEIADKLSISVNTANIHRQNILRKMKVDNSIEAINYAKHVGLLD